MPVLGRDVDGTRLAAGTVAGEGSTGGGVGLGQRIWWKWTVGGIFRKLRVVWSEERMWKPSRRIRLSFRKPG